MKVLFHYAAGPDLSTRLSAISELDIAICPPDDDALLARVLPDTDVLWHVLKPCTAAMIAAAPRLVLIQKIGVGVNTIDLEAAKARAIPVCNLPGTNARAVAEMTLLLMLAALRRLPRFDRSLREGVWLDPVLQDGLGELAGRKVGLIGYGAVPRLLAPILRAMGCDVVFHTREWRDEPHALWAPLESLLAESDIISLHVPLTPETDKMIGRETLARMKPGAVLINTARGGLIDQPALVDALRSGRLSAAGLDVFTDEPVPAGEPLLSLPNVVIAPHVAWLTTGTFDRSFALAAENCRRVREGLPLLHRVC